jgi:hypothetical protein
MARVGPQRQTNHFALEEASLKMGANPIAEIQCVQ